MKTLGFNIAAVERDTGLSKDVLRVWERRYGFPSPERDPHGERIYPTDQVDRLRLIKRLMDQGHRPGKLIAASTEELTALSPRRSRQRAPAEDPTGSDLDELLDLIRGHDAAGFQQAMQQRLGRQGLHQFVQDTVAPLTYRIGQAWEEGSIHVFEEHFFTELTKRLLRQAITTLPPGRGARILLTSLPDEPHVLGLLMVEALLTLEGARCIPLGAQMPLTEIQRAASAHQADIVGLSFSAAFPTRQIPSLLGQLRALLPTGTALWAGGAGVRHVPPVNGVHCLNTLEDAVTELAKFPQAA